MGVTVRRTGSSRRGGETVLTAADHSGEGRHHVQRDLVARDIVRVGDAPTPGTVPVLVGRAENLLAGDLEELMMGKSSISLNNMGSRLPLVVFLNKAPIAIHPLPTMSRFRWRLMSFMQSC